jgi:hypothetical protein
MGNDFDIIVGPVISEKQKVKQEFKRETCLAFEFDLDAFDDEDGALGYLEQIAFGKRAEYNDPPERMEKLVEHFTDGASEPVRRYLICNVFTV